MIDNKTLNEICKAGKGKDCCRYIVCGSGGFECAKLTDMKSIIDNRVRSMTAQGDNCDGMDK